jgi:hypothetical protein
LKQTYRLTVPAPMLTRGFWLYVWRVKTPSEELLYVGRTGDNSSPKATSPFLRMGQHLGNQTNSNALLKHLLAARVKPEQCLSLEFVAHGPLFPEEPTMEKHLPVRNVVAALERALAEDLAAVGYRVLNTVRCHQPLDAALHSVVLTAFATDFPKLNTSLGGRSPT